MRSAWRPCGPCAWGSSSWWPLIITSLPYRLHYPHAFTAMREVKRLLVRVHHGVLLILDFAHSGQDRSPYEILIRRVGDDPDDAQRRLIEDDRWHVEIG